MSRSHTLSICHTPNTPSFHCVCGCCGVWLPLHCGFPRHCPWCHHGDRRSSGCVARRGEHPVSEHADRSYVLLGHEAGHQVQTEAGHLLTVHLQQLVSHPQQPRIQLLCAAVAHLLHVHTYKADRIKYRSVLLVRLHTPSL